MNQRTYLGPPLSCMHQPGSNVIQKKRVTSDPAQKLSIFVTLKTGSEKKR